MQEKDHFSQKADNWDKGSKRLQTVDAIAENILENIHVSKEMHLLDFGSGTGLLTERLAPYVKKISCVDTSDAMNKKLLEKEFPCEIELRDIAELPSDSIDGIISSMTLHHIKEIEALFKKFHSLLRKDSFLALADLVSEDGTFHSDNRGVHHYGFETKELIEIAQKVGFKDVAIRVITSIHKPHNSFDIFLLTAKK